MTFSATKYLKFTQKNLMNMKATWGGANNESEKLLKASQS